MPASEPAFYDSTTGTLGNGSVIDPVNANDSFPPNAWGVEIHNSGTTDEHARAWVVCGKTS